MSTTINSANTRSSIDNIMDSMNPKPTAPADSVQADTDKFMKLLVTQLKNQDPLNPLDNAQVTSQLAQLSTVTGVNKLNTTLESLKGSYQTAESMQAANLIEKTVLVEGDTTYLTDGAAVFGLELGTPADKVKIIITDPATGKDVATIDMGAQEAGILPIGWDGAPDPADPNAPSTQVILPNGQYTFRAEVTRGGEKLTDFKTLSFDSVGSITIDPKTGVKLNLANKGTVTMSDIKQIL
ncbi:flagellar hook assembly protein FlgD [Massilia niastensis]|uniref:flagellar hook assembly protein FlgD n=1 Tax=Massilia niastensis TaxID=544911 RepID=UPI000362DF24|nr:flagellar hook assembly protein FlgD [Massilia niastensis]